MAALFIPVPVQKFIESKVVDAAEGVGCPKMIPKVRRGSKIVLQPKLVLTTKAYFKVFHKSYYLYIEACVLLRES